MLSQVSLKFCLFLKFFFFFILIWLDYFQRPAFKFWNYSSVWSSLLLSLSNLFFISFNESFNSRWWVPPNGECMCQPWQLGVGWSSGPWQRVQVRGSTCHAKVLPPGGWGWPWRPQHWPQHFLLQRVGNMHPSHVLVQSGLASQAQPLQQNWLTSQIQGIYVVCNSTLVHWSHRPGWDQASMATFTLLKSQGCCLIASTGICRPWHACFSVLTVGTLLFMFHFHRQ